IFHILNSNNKNYDNATLTLAALIISIEKFFISQNETELNLIRINNKKVNKNQKNKKLLTYWSVVKELKEKKHMSFREISEFLKKSHKFEVSHSLIYRVWIEVEKKETI
ncbi:MAG: helix-turn-helix domain-containing protein, partial [Aliarcobacter sp.]|nr:helix-turn-helix domain-containing protein [Aliarcobacter sp.]